jgi:hypothetical protein
LLLLRGLSRRLLRPSAAGTLLLRLDGNGLDLAFLPATDGAAAGDHGGPARSDTGRTAALLDRLAQRLGWELQVLSPTRIRISLPR